MRARVDRGKCMGAGWCLIAAPQAFRADADGRSYAVNSASCSEHLLREAAEGCPSQAILLEDDDGRQIYPKRWPGAEQGRAMVREARAGR